MPSPDDPSLEILPWDLYRCGACEQLLQADGRGWFPDAAVAACQGRCEWDLVARHEP